MYYIKEFDPVLHIDSIQQSLQKSNTASSIPFFKLYWESLTED